MMSTLYEIEYWGFDGPPEDENDITQEQKLQLSERAVEILRLQLKYMQDHLASLRDLIRDKENIIENLMMRYDIGLLQQDNNIKESKESEEIRNPDTLRLLFRKCWKFTQETILENFEIREKYGVERDTSFHLRNEKYELVKFYAYIH